MSGNWLWMTASDLGRGIGAGKIKSLKKELGDAVDLMVAIKRTFDPDNLMNPGKVVPL